MSYVNCENSRRSVTELCPALYRNDLALIRDSGKGETWQLFHMADDDGPIIEQPGALIPRDAGTAWDSQRSSLERFR